MRRREKEEAHLLCDCTGAVNELPFGEAVGRSDLQRSGLLDQEDAPMSELLHSSLDLKTDLNETQRLVIHTAAT